MKTILHQATSVKNSKVGRSDTLSIAKPLIMRLMQCRQYRTYRHYSLNFGVSASRVYQTIKWVEGVLIKGGCFSLLGKKALDDLDNQIEVMLVDAPQTPRARLKKAEAVLVRQEKTAYINKLGGS